MDYSVYIFSQISVGNAVDSAVEHGVPYIQALMIGVIIFLASVAGVLAVYIKNLHQQSHKEKQEYYNEQKQMTERVTTAMINQTHALENNTKVADKIYEHLLNATQR